MKAVPFPQANSIFGVDEEGKTQEGIFALPAYRAPNAEQTVTTCYELDPEELAEVQITGRIWFQVWTFGQALHPQLASAFDPFEEFKKQQEAQQALEGKPKLIIEGQG